MSALKRVRVFRTICTSSYTKIELGEYFFLLEALGSCFKVQFIFLSFFFSKKCDSFKPPLQPTAEIVLLQCNLDFTPLQLFITVFWTEIRMCSSQAFNMLTPRKVDADTHALKTGCRTLGTPKSKAEM